MLCPKCKKGKLLVNGHYPGHKEGNVIVRYRKCDQCGKRVKTVEYMGTIIDPKTGRDRTVKLKGKKKNNALP